MDSSTRTSARLIRTLMTCLVLLICIGARSQALGQLRVYPEGELPKDRRLEPLKDLDGYFPFEVPSTQRNWEQRATELKRQVQVATGLWPMPEKTPLNARVFGLTKRDGFTVEKVYFESLPGHYVTGLLFRPEGKGTKRPAVLSPHGHEGRLWDYGEKSMPRLIEQGAERFEKSGRFPQLARCATGSYGMRGVYLRYGRLCRQPAVVLRVGPPLRQTTARFKFQIVLGIL